MIVCMQGPNHSEKPNLIPGFDLILDPVVAQACGMVFNSPDLDHAEAQLKRILDNNKYHVGHGGHHVFVLLRSSNERQALLVDTNDHEIKHSYPSLESWVWPWP